MLTTAILFHDLSDDILTSTIQYEDLSSIEGIFFLDSQETLDSKFLYIGTQEDILSAIHSMVLPKSITFFCAVGDARLLPALEKFSLCGCNLVFFSLDPMLLYNHAYAALHRFWNLQIQLNSLTSPKHELQEMTDLFYNSPTRRWWY